MSLLTYPIIKSIKDWLFLKSRTIVGSANTVAPDVTFNSPIFDIKKSTVNIGVRFGSTTSSTAKFSLQIVGYDDSDAAVFVTDEEIVERFGGGTYYQKQFAVPVKRIRVNVKNYDTVALAGAVINYSEIDDINKFEHQMTGLRTLVAGDNITNKIKVNKSAFNVNLYWVTEPNNYTLYARFYDKNNNIVSINAIHTGTVDNKSNRRMVSTPINTELVDFNIQLAAGEAGQIRSLIAKEVDNVPYPTYPSVSIDRSLDKSLLVFPSTVIAAGATVTSARLNLNNANNIINIIWSVRPQFFKVQAVFYRNNSIVDILDLYERKLGSSLTYYKAFFQKLGDVVEIKITNTSTTSSTVGYSTITQLDSPLVDDTWENVYERINQSIKTTVQKESAGYDEFDGAWRTKQIFRPDFYNTIFSPTVKKSNTSVNDYFFLQKGAKMVRIYLKITDIVGTPFANGQGLKLSVKAGEKGKGTEITLLDSEIVQNGNYIMLLGQKDETIKSTNLLFGDRLKIELSFTGTINSGSYFTYEVFAYTKF
ncbi:hypothetical protein [Sphingobacterium paramultivorum]|uniref:hypothetical protein n=1 Tax=Sphingobacterium paramultivorum TaxID=2886510 RepID=UPI00129CD127|nr:hypothetical protein [Sphingobacterium paramultivorum]